MSASPARARRGRVRRLAAGVCACALAFPPAAAAADREITVSAAAPAAWEGTAALTSALFDPATLTPCGGSFADVCDTTLVHVLGSGTLSLELTGLGAATGDVDLYVHRSDALGLAGPLLASSTAAGPGERVHVPAASGSYLVRVASFSVGTAGFAGSAALAPRPATIPDVDGPRGRREALVSDPGAGAASQPALARDGDTVVAAYRVFGGEDYVSQIATAVSFDGGRRWEALGAVSAAAAANPALAFDDRGDVLLLSNELPGTVVLRRWASPSEHDVRHDGTWSAPQPLSAGHVDERPVLARAGSILLACWVRSTDLGGYARQQVLCRRSGDLGATWDDPTRLSPSSRPGVPYGPYVGGVAVAGRRGELTVAWVDTSDPGRADTAWIARSADGVAWGAATRVASFRSLPERFAGDAFRNVTLLTAAATRHHVYLAYAADAGGHADVRLVRSDGAGWSEPVTIAEHSSDQFQPSLAAAGRDVYLSFLDRRLNAPFLDEWLASSDDHGATWRAERLSHDSWDPSIGAPRSPTGDLLGDHQALVADRCSAIAVAADPHLANPRRRDRDFDHGLPRLDAPQLFSWRVGDSRCD